MPHDEHRPPAKAAEAADDRGVVGILAVAVELDEAGEQLLDVVQGVRPLGAIGQPTSGVPGATGDSLG